MIDNNNRKIIRNDNNVCNCKNIKTRLFFNPVLSVSATTAALVVLLACFSVVESQFNSYYWDGLMKGSYCASRPSNNQCCRGRNDGCFVPHHGTLCYCDDFCNKTHTSGLEDCCPDYKPVCLNLPSDTDSHKCYYNGQFLSDGESQKINCNECKCQWMGDRMDLVCDHTECIINTTLITYVNEHRDRFGWHARNYSEFWGRHLAEGISYRLGTLLSAKKIRDTPAINPDYDPRRLPSSFDARIKWRGLIEMPRDQGWCGASWAISTVTVLSDRMNIHLGSHFMPLAPQHLLSCNVGNQPGTGCTGGHLTRAWIFIRKFGLVEERCYPWQGERTKCVIPKRRKANESRCTSQQMQRSPLYRATPVYRISGEQDIMYEIQKSGPVQATMRVYQDFFSYGGGIYKCSGLSKTFRTGHHSVRIIGWGEENQNGETVKYWIAVNSWGSSWGENGYFRIRRGNNDCNIEEFVLAAWATQERTPTIDFKNPTNIDNQISNTVFKK